MKKTKMKTITIKEFEYLQCRNKNEKNYISENIFKTLENFALKNESYNYLKPIYKKGYGKVLQVQNYVGVIQTKNILIEILPKLSNFDDEKLRQIVINMLKTLKKSPFKKLNFSNIKNIKMPLLEIFISIFLEELSILIKKGLKSDYILKEENLKFLKGRLKLKEQIKKNFIHKERFFVEYDEFLVDRIENRLIKTTLKYLYNLSNSMQNQKRIREFLFVFEEVGISHNIKSDFAKIKLNRQMRDYENILLYSKIFLQNKSFTPFNGDDIVYALLFDMNLLFESFVGDYIKKRCKNVSLQDKTHHLVKTPKKFALKPDIVINNGEIIMDTKWKILDQNKNNYRISQTDMYQMYAYGKKYEKCKKLYLIYPKNNKFNIPEFEYEKNLHLKVLFFDFKENKLKDCKEKDSLC